MCVQKTCTTQKPVNIHSLLKTVSLLPFTFMICVHRAKESEMISWLKIFNALANSSYVCLCMNIPVSLFSQLCFFFMKYFRQDKQEEKFRKKKRMQTYDEPAFDFYITSLFESFFFLFYCLNWWSNCLFFCDWVGARFNFLLLIHRGSTCERYDLSNAR